MPWKSDKTKPAERRRLSIDALRAMDARRVCVIKPSALGDVVQALPLLPVLRERFPAATLSWVINAELAGLLEGHPQLDEVLRFERYGSVGGWWRLARELRRRRFDLVFDLQGLLRTGVMTAATGAPVRVGLQSAREGSRWACQLLLPDTGPLVPAHIRYWRVAEALGMEDCRREAHVAIPAGVSAQARRHLEALPRPLLAVSPGARWRTKRWPVESFAAIAARAARTFGYSTVIVGGAADAEAAARIEEMLRSLVPGTGMLNLAGRTSLKALAAVLEQVDVTLTNDS
ncbi:MAG: glycosyltransferase family 9 protein, partial [Planctomycetes bacterium]|nr:glycosyltransferase family 9 protein [Planctomycetota bacterium]